MHAFIDHARDFAGRIAAAGEERETFGRLAEGQSPEALFITCSDSRVIPSLFTGARPGQLFELRTAGNAVPEYAEGASGESATIEYAVSVLQVPDIVVCGHSHCGAVRARVHGEDLAAVPAVAGWLERQLPHLPVRDPESGIDDDARVAGHVQRHVKAQLDRLRQYPCVREGLAAGRLRLHGWYYAIDTGLVMQHDQAADAFLPL
ncbi:carbonic anhydrase [Streptomyces sp. B-S-A8]|uniref:Carbonic anhydrase n=1 Tax=Streptomyces solicavernae TaxID=3043614 RepID=A0ABT6RYQ3_9ACTN|nr:carbonic anhydrase [Streptomyces sp. B-S-A8]MDI3388796.1 carbonic anhydrase [Streptomyces sp. B-S-A8]